jgi:hypothetical protein
MLKLGSTMSLVCLVILEIYILLKPNLVNFLPKAMVLFWIRDQCRVKVIYNTILYILYYKVHYYDQGGRSIF